MHPAGAFMGNPRGAGETGAAPRGGNFGGGNRALIPIFLASAFLFFVAYQLFGAAAAAVVIVLFGSLALAAHRVKVTRGFPFLHLSSLGLGDAVARRAGGGGGGSGQAAAAPGMDAAGISALPAAFAYKRDETVAGWVQCAICLGLVRAGEAVRRLPACGHLFHAGCVDEWLRAHATCPLCRAAVHAPRPELPV